MKTLVTGATGFIGSELVRQLVGQGYDVRILRRRTSSLDLLGTVSDQVEHAIGDLRDPFSVQKALRGIEYVFHAAARVSFSGRKRRKKLHAINVRGTAHVVNAALREGVQRFVHTSSVAALGPPTPPEEVVDETTRWRTTKATSMYARSKHQAELEVYRGQAEGLEVVIVNPSLVFGPEDPNTLSMRLVKPLQRGRMPGVPPGGINVVDVIDVAAGHIAALEQGTAGERYFLGSEDLSWREVMKTLARALDIQSPRFTLSPAMLVGAGYAAEFIAFLTRTRARFTRQMAHAATNFYPHSNQKAREELDLKFRPFKETAERIASSIED